LTGSGAALFTLFEQEDAARTAAARITGEREDVFVAAMIDDGSWR
jgi:4-diphosphocytidyl-2C-methyl-D-erythritol kinase